VVKGCKGRNSKWIIKSIQKYYPISLLRIGVRLIRLVL
jgi:hypothetical protein